MGGTFSKSWYSGISFIAALELARMSTLRHAGYYT
ncbi:hypothetical protein F441_05929 [Phytophthora nicotianae CJ01A1]|uniref:Uncharacterized protein n=1 Tax=Phytophthora nicotianae CJ01A1 TaxID=1317063 RepID=W2XCW0_PHYNI|nr:hypothetical protein F441_05929 [Phytophthora nicotianae CJ01A1]